MQVKKNQSNNESELTDYQKRLREFIIEVQSLYNIKKGILNHRLLRCLKQHTKELENICMVTLIYYAGLMVEIHAVIQVL